LYYFSIMSDFPNFFYDKPLAKLG